MNTGRVGSRSLLVIAFCVAAGTAPAGEADLGSTRSAVAKWVETQQIISKEKKDWQLGKEVLEQRIELVENETAALEQKLDETHEAIAEADSRRGELAERKRSLTSAATSLRETVGTLEADTLRLVATLPGPIRDKVKPLSQRIPTDPAGTELSLSQRYQNVIGILNEVNKFNGDVTVTAEMLPLSDGTTAEVTAMYIGLGQAYYVTASGNAAGVGRPTPDGWQWTSADHLAPEIAEAVAILKNTETPAFVPLPVEIR